jgi:ribonuclease HII
MRSENQIIGVDEAGRGPLAGPVVAAAVMFHSDMPAGLADSKKLSAKKRAVLVPQIKACSHWAIAVVSAEEIDRRNILQASLWAMRQALASLSLGPQARVRIDGNLLPNLEGLSYLDAIAVVQGDSLVPAISAASILAKEHRDEIMRELDRRYPQYGFAKHSGYGVPAHLEALRVHGPCPEHRCSFAPVKAASDLRSRGNV